MHYLAQEKFGGEGNVMKTFLCEYIHPVARKALEEFSEITSIVSSSFNPLVIGSRKYKCWVNTRITFSEVINII